MIREYLRRYNAAHHKDEYASAFFAWLASHRKRLRLWTLGTPRLCIIVCWDREGRKIVERTDAEVEAMAIVVHGEKAVLGER